MVIHELTSSWRSWRNSSPSLLSSTRVSHSSILVAFLLESVDPFVAASADIDLNEVYAATLWTGLGFAVEQSPEVPVAMAEGGVGCHSHDEGRDLA